MTKTEQRRLALAARRALGDEQRGAYSAALCERLLNVPEVRAAKTVLSYRALPDEADPAALERKLDARIAYPLCLSEGGMEARVPTGALRPGPYGILEPDPEASLLVPPEEIELVLAPCVAFDAQRRRLGHGAGYYDRYLPRCNHACVIAVAFEVQRLERVVTDERDVRMDLIVTEKTEYR